MSLKKKCAGLNEREKGGESMQRERERERERERGREREEREEREKGDREEREKREREEREEREREKETEREIGEREREREREREERDDYYALQSASKPQRQNTPSKRKYTMPMMGSNLFFTMLTSTVWLKEITCTTMLLFEGNFSAFFENKQKLGGQIRREVWPRTRFLLVGDRGWFLKPQRFATKLLL